MRRKIENERDARTCLRAATAAGVSAGEWAREHGVDGRSLNAWRINLARAGASEQASGSSLRLVELVPAPAPRAAARYVVHVSGAQIELADDFREETLVRLVRALRAC
jgi:transposase-like protein